ncbi:MAG: LytTR family transcriptional regulator DNA-binding domain-containing protein [Lentimicrobiaceae bacterium]|nr:LytTR family transcriptional regulator DNA-binding domain-containing protein [Lentimicrobiaceae bacterium]
MKFDYNKQRSYKLPIREKSKISFIDISEILYLQCDGYLTTIYLIDNKNIGVAKLLKQFEEELGKYGFLRANHHTLVNTQHINAIQISKQRRIIYIKEVEIQISRRKFYLFKDSLW